MSGKGSAPRPLSVSDEEFGKRFDAIDWSVGYDLATPEGDVTHVTHNSVMKTTLDALVADYKAMGWQTRSYIGPKNQGYTLDAWKP